MIPSDKISAQGGSSAAPLPVSPACSKSPVVPAAGTDVATVSAAAADADAAAAPAAGSIAVAVGVSLVHGRRLLATMFNFGEHWVKDVGKVAEGTNATAFGARIEPAKATIAQNRSQRGVGRVIASEKRKGVLQRGYTAAPTRQS